MNKVSKIFTEHKNMFKFFFIILISLFIGNADALPDTDVMCYSFHIIDFRVGFVSRVLPGQIFSWIVKNPSIQAVKIYESVLMVLVCLCTSFFLEKVYLAAPEKKRLTYTYFIVLFCISGFIFHIYYRQLGMLDVYWVYSFVFFLLFLQSSKTWTFIPLCYIFAIAVNYGSLFNYIPLMSTILLLEASMCEDKKKKKFLLAVFAASMIATLGSLAFFMHNEQHNIKLSMEQFHRYMESKGCDYYSYYDYALFDEYTIHFAGRENVIERFDVITSSAVPSFIKNLINNVAYQAYINIRAYRDTEFVTAERFVHVIALIISGLPFVIFLSVSYRKLFKASENKLKRFALLCAIMLFPFAFFGAMFQSIDVTRFFCGALTCTFICFLYLLFKDRDTFGEIVHSLFIRIKQEYLLLYAILSFLTRFHPYY